MGREGSQTSPSVSLCEAGFLPRGPEATSPWQSLQSHPLEAGLRGGQAQQLGRSSDWCHLPAKGPIEGSPPTQSPEQHWRGDTKWQTLTVGPSHRTGEDKTQSCLWQ